MMMAQVATANSIWNWSTVGMGLVEPRLPLRRE